jgi:hypothetical protein
MDLFKSVTVLSSEKATVFPYLTFQFFQDGMQVYRLEHPVYADPNRPIRGVAETIAEIPHDVRPVFLEEPHPRLHRFRTGASSPRIGS